MQNAQQSKADIGVAFWNRMEQLINGEEPFAWAARHGINKSTFQSAKTRCTRPLTGTLETWSTLIGCNLAWLKDGVGEPFNALSVTPAPVQNEKIELDLQLLTLSIETLETVLDETPRKMSASQKTHLILAIYQLYATSSPSSAMRKTIETFIRSAV